MDKKKGILLVLLFGILFFNGTKTFALDQPNFDSEEQTVVFHLIEEKGGNAFMDKQPPSDPNQKMKHPLVSMLLIKRSRFSKGGACFLERMILSC